MSCNKLNILIVEDEIISTEYLISILKSLNYQNFFDADNMEDALKIIKKNKIDLVFMDININGSTDGITCAKILNQKYFLPIIYTTAYKDTQCMIEANDTNIFGYLIKPFGKKELEAVLLIALKQIEFFTQEKKQKLCEDKSIINLNKGQKYNLSTNTFCINNKVIDLTKKELDILSILCQNLNQNISYETLKFKAWGKEDISNSTIRDAISKLKRKTPDLNIKTIINFGYVLKS